LRPVDGQLLAGRFSACKRGSAASPALEQACLGSIFATLDANPVKHGFSDGLMTLRRHCNDHCSQ
jgi:hypothetical protein